MLEERLGSAEGLSRLQQDIPSLPTILRHLRELLFVEPRFLEVTTIAPCPVNCAQYCPQDKLRLAYRGVPLLSLPNFKKALSNVPRDVAISFAGYGEPFLSPWCKDMILHTQKEGYRIALFTTLSNITMKTWNSIKYVPFKFITIHLPDVDGITKVKITEDYLSILEDLKKRRRPKVTFMSMGDIIRDVREVLPDYQYSFVSNERGGNCRGVKLKTHYGTLSCRMLNVDSTTYIMLPDCTVTLCSMDYQMRHRVGNLLETKYDELYNSPEVRRVLDSTRSPEDPYALCRTCLWAKPIHL
jgi:hypothetical protein